MNPIVVLLLGMLVVVGGVLWLRLHAFVALIAGALIVAALTPRQAVYDQAVDSVGERVTKVDDGARRYALKKGSKDGVRLGDRYVLMRRNAETGEHEQVATLRVDRFEWISEGKERAFVRIVDDDQTLSIAKGDVIIDPSDAAGAQKTSKKTFAARVAQGFGDTAVKIGILIAMAAIIGKCLLDSGAAERIVASAMRLTGEKRAPLALTGSSFLLAIPVFFDTVFYLMIPLGKALRRRTGRNYTLYVIAIVAGGTMAHSLVPPTPGPLFVAEQMGVDLGLMMLGGCVVGLAAVSVGYLYALWANKRWDIPLRDEGAMIEEGSGSQEEKTQAAEAAAPAAPGGAGGGAPPLWLALMPILLPVVLIAGKTALDMKFKGVAAEVLPGWYAALKPTVTVLGDKNLALVLAAAVALVTLAMYRRKSRTQLTAAVQTALASGGVIILITAAGGAFGAVLRQTDIAAEMQRLAPTGDMGLLLLPLAFAVTALVRTAQGSATVAMITAVGVIAPITAPLVADGTLGYHPLYLALAIGCGSKPISWMNDSGFWVIGKMSGMTEAETLKTSSMVMIVMAAVGLAVVLIGASLVPLV